MEEMLRQVIPYEDESLASFLLRLSEANAIELKNLFLMRKFNFIHEVGKISSIIGDDRLDKISHITNLSVAEVKNMTTDRFPKIERNVHLSILNPSKSEKYFCEHPFLDIKRAVYCPKCISEKSYHKIYWYNSPMKICILHGNELVSKCPSCGKAVDVHSIVKGYCYCGYNLKETETIEPSSAFVNSQIEIFEMLGFSGEKGIIKESESLEISSYQNLLEFCEKHDLKCESIFNENSMSCFLDNVLESTSQGYNEIKREKYEYQFGHYGVMGSIIDEAYMLRYNVAFENTVYNYVLNHYTVDNLKKRFLRLLVEDEYISYFDACREFEFAGNGLDGQVRQFIAGNSVEVILLLEEVISMVRQLLKLCNSGFLNPMKNQGYNYTDTYETYGAFREFGLRESEIIRLLCTSGIKCKLCPTAGAGLKMIRIPKNEFYKTIFRYLAEKH